MEKTLTAGDLCDWLKITFDQLVQLRRCRDATAFPPPLLGGHGLVWYEQDVCDWVCFISDWQDLIADGLDPQVALEQLEPPVFLAIEPELRVRAADAKDAR